MQDRGSALRPGRQSRNHVDRVGAGSLGGPPRDLRDDWAVLFSVATMPLDPATGFNTELAQLRSDADFRVAECQIDQGIGCTDATHRMPGVEKLQRFCGLDSPRCPS